MARRRRSGAGTPVRVRRRPGPRRGRALPAGTRDLLLRAGADVFAERGFDGATAERIARRAGATKAMINYHFRSKKGLYEAILVATFAEIAARLDAVRAGGGAAPDQLRAFIHVFARAAAEHPAFPPMMVREVLSGGEHLPADAFPRMLGIVGAVRGIVDQGIEEGRFRPVNPLLTHLALVGSLLFFFATEPFRRRALPRLRGTVAAPTPEGFVRYLEELTIRGLAVNRAPRRRRRTAALAGMGS